MAHDASKVVAEAKPPPTFPSRSICIKVTDCSHGAFFSSPKEFNMSIHTDELRTQKLEALITPRELATSSPLTPELARHILQARQEIEAILAGNDQRLLVIIGPCSLHDPEAALAYARQLAALRLRYADSLCIVMRAYFEKPRTIVGWKGLINDPDIDGSHNIRKGLLLARKTLIGVLGGVVFLGEPLGWQEIAAALLILGAVGSVSLKR